jgi:hypothetical protein
MTCSGCQSTPGPRLCPPFDQLTWNVTYNTRHMIQAPVDLNFPESAIPPLGALR